MNNLNLKVLCLFKYCVISNFNEQKEKLETII